MNPKSRQLFEKGQSLVEFSLGLVVLLLVLCGLLDLGRVYFTFIALEDGVGEAALYLSLHPLCRTKDNVTAIPHECDDPNNATYRAYNSGGFETVDWNKATFTFSVPAASVGEPVKVTVDYSYPLLTPIIPRIAGMNPLKISASASQIIITE